MGDDGHQCLSSIFARRSIRIFDDGAIEDTIEQSLLEAGMAAPSACCKDPWRFISIRNRDTLHALADGLPHGQMLRTAGLAISVCGDTRIAHDHQISYLLQDCSAAIENILIVASLLDLGAVWLGVHPREQQMEYVRNLLGIPDFVVPVAVIAIGKPGEKKPARTRYNPDYVHKEKW